ncbi:hypothetical protein LTR17_010922 [Elasticomyces elasticus]|nr:hypothetical protein LTR17_010922 [Elasticomyces elasticus]
MAGTARRSRITAPGHRPGRNDSNRISKDKRSTTSSAAAAAMVKHTKPTVDDPDAPTLCVSIDYGTKTLASSVLVLKPGVEPATEDVENVNFSVKTYWAPQLVAWDDHDNFYWGYGVVEALKSKKLNADHVIGLWKLLLYKNHLTSVIGDRVRKQIGDRSLDDLLTTHFAAILVEVKTWAKKTSAHIFAKYTDDVGFYYEIDAMPVEVFLSVPQMWKAPANLRMTTAAKRAGIKYVELVYEPQSAAGYFTGRIRHELPRTVDVGDVLLVADLGGGTGDFVSLKYVSTSDTCGSEFVNENFLAWLNVEAVREFGVGGFEELCTKQLGITKATGVSQANTQFEPFKQDFSSLEADPVYISIRGVKGAPLAVWERVVTCDHLVNFFAPVIEKIFACIDRQIADGQIKDLVKAMIIPGGFGASMYLLSKIEEKYKHIKILGQTHDAVGAFQPVARGALYRYSNIETRGLPSTESFGIGTVEVWDPQVHVDAVDTGRGRGGHFPRPNWDIVDEDPFEPSHKIVYDRWTPILQKGDSKAPGKPFTCEKWQQYYVHDGETEITQQIFWTQANIAPHARMLKRGKGYLEEGAVLRDEIEPWGDAMVFQLPILKALGFSLQKSKKQGKVYEIWYKLKLTCNGANVSISFQLAMPYSKLYDDKHRFNPEGVELTEDDVHEVVAASHNPNPRTSTN